MARSDPQKGRYVKSKLKTARTSRCVTFGEVRDYCKIDVDDDDALLNNLIDAAQDTVENYTNRKLSSATWYLYLDDFPSKDIVLPFAPVTSVTSVKYYDTDDNQQTYVEDTDYYTNLNAEPCKITDINGWDGVYDKPDAVEVEYVTGYTTGVNAIPLPLKQAVLLLISDMYDNRMDRPHEKFSTWKLLASDYRVWHSVTENA